MRVFGTKSTTYSAPRYSSVWPRWRPKPFTSVTVMPETPISDSAARTSSSLNGLMIAVTSFMCELSVGVRRYLYDDSHGRFCSFHATLDLPVNHRVCAQKKHRPVRTMHHSGARCPHLFPSWCIRLVRYASADARANRDRGCRPGSRPSRRYTTPQRLYG